MHYLWDGFGTSKTETSDNAIKFQRNKLFDSENHLLSLDNSFILKRKPGARSETQSQKQNVKQSVQLSIRNCQYISRGINVDRSHHPDAHAQTLDWATSSTSQQLDQGAVASLLKLIQSCRSFLTHQSTPEISICASAMS
jgi:hypothetical protein